jgi:hypothetical protein
VENNLFSSGIVFGHLLRPWNSSSNCERLMRHALDWFCEVELSMLLWTPVFDGLEFDTNVGE